MSETPKTDALHERNKDEFPEVVNAYKRMKILADTLERHVTYLAAKESRIQKALESACLEAGCSHVAVLGDGHGDTSPEELIKMLAEKTKKGKSK